MTDPRSIYQATYYEEALRDWILLIAAEIEASIVVRYANQRGYKAQRPFITLQVLSDVDRGVYHNVTDTPDGSDYEGEVLSSLMGTVSINIFSVSHRRIASALKASLYRADVQELLSNDKVYVSRMISRQDVSEALSTSFEPRTAIDFAFSYAERCTYTAQAIEEVEVTVTGQSQTGDITQIVTVP